MTTNQVKLNNTIIKNYKNNITILQLCEELGYEIPRYCYHSQLSIAGNCRMCLIEVKGTPKPVAACSTPLINNMEIFTNTSLVLKTRENIMEFLLINHPLDCPICDQGGECDLQDQSIFFGSDLSRFKKINKRKVERKFFGNIIKGIMTRCIHCTRCIRFMDEVAQESLLGTVGRGVKTEISTYKKRNKISKIYTELSSNIIDLCPVGALTSKIQAFKLRSWETKLIEGFDFTNSFLTNILYEIRDAEIVRIMPSNNRNLKTEWLSNKSRYYYDTYKFNIIENYYYCSKVSNILNIQKIFNLFQKYIKKNKKLLIFSKQLDLDTLIKLKSSQSFYNFYMEKSKRFLSLTLNKQYFDNSILTYYHFNLKEILKSDFIISFYITLKTSCVLLDTMLKENVKKKKLIMYNFGLKEKSSKYYSLGFNIIKQIFLFYGKLKYSIFFKKYAKIPFFFFNSALLYQTNSQLYTYLISNLEIKLKKNINQNYFQYSSTLTDLELNLLNSKNNFIFLKNNFNLLFFNSISTKNYKNYKYNINKTFFSNINILQSNNIKKKKINNFFLIMPVLNFIEYQKISFLGLENQIKTTLKILETSKIYLTYKETLNKIIQKVKINDYLKNYFDKRIIIFFYYFLNIHKYLTKYYLKKHFNIYLNTKNQADLFLIENSNILKKIYKTTITSYILYKKKYIAIRAHDMYILSKAIYFPKNSKKKRWRISYWMSLTL